MSRPRTRQVLLAQGGYYAATGIAPFVSRRGFERITGPKVDWWLVQTTGALVTAVGAGLLSAAAQRRETPEIVGIAAGCAAGLAALDTVHALRGRIAPVYLVDAIVQLAALAGYATSGRHS
jgi:hypothetical protein